MVHACDRALEPAICPPASRAANDSAATSGAVVVEGGAEVPGATVVAPGSRDLRAAGCPFRSAGVLPRLGAARDSAALARSRVGSSDNSIRSLRRRISRHAGSLAAALHRIGAPTAAAGARGSGEGLGNCGALLRNLRNGVGLPAEGAGDRADCEHARAMRRPRGGGDRERRGDLDADAERIGPRTAPAGSGPAGAGRRAIGPLPRVRCSRPPPRSRLAHVPSTREDARRPWCRGVSDLSITRPATTSSRPSVARRGDAARDRRRHAMPMAVPPRSGVAQEAAARLRRQARPDLRHVRAQGVDRGPAQGAPARASARSQRIR